MAFTVKQQEFLYNATCRWNIKEGATRSGKTYLDYYVIPKRIRKVAGKEGLTVILGNTKGTLQRNIIGPLQDIWGTKLVGSIKSDNTATLFGEEVYCLGADKANQVDRLRGSSIKYCYGDEVVTWHKDVFDMLKSRLDKDYSKFDGTCNPDSPNHWFLEFLNSDVDLYRQSYTIDDNPYLSASFVENLKREYAGSVYYDRYILGKWCRAEGLIYDTFIQDKHVLEVLPGKFSKKWVAVDYGTQNATCFLLMGKSAGRIYVIKEYYYSGRDSQKQKTDSQYRQDLREFIAGHAINDVIVDPSAASFITELRQNGLPVMNADNSVLDGIRKVSSTFGLDQLYISSSCTNLIKELGGYVWDDKASDEKPIKENDHAMDALRYGVMYADSNIFISY